MIPNYIGFDDAVPSTLHCSVDLQNNGVFTISGNAVGMNSDITAAVSTITDQSQRISSLHVYMFVYPVFDSHSVLLRGRPP